MPEPVTAYDHIADRVASVEARVTVVEALLNPQMLTALRGILDDGNHADDDE